MFYLIEDNASLPESVELPALFAGDSSEIHLLGYPKKLKIRVIKGKKQVTLPTSFLKGSCDTPAIVFTNQCAK